jgi:hypothetical protein
MDKTPFSKKCEIIKDFSDLYRDLYWTEDYFGFYNLGIPYAVGAHYGDITLNEKGTKEVDEAWKGLLKLFSLDPYAAFDSLDDLMAFADE